MQAVHKVGRLLALLPLVLALAVATGLPASAAVIDAFTQLVPPSPLPQGVAPNGHGRAERLLETGVRERLKVDINDVAVIADPADPLFCMGFYEVVLVKNGAEQKLPQFPGIIANCVAVPPDPRGPNRGSQNFIARLDKGEPAINSVGGTLLVYAVEPVRDPVTRKLVPGPNGEPFQIASRTAVALQGGPLN